MTIHSLAAGSCSVLFRRFPFCSFLYLPFLSSPVLSCPAVFSHVSSHVSLFFLSVFFVCLCGSRSLSLYLFIIYLSFVSFCGFVLCHPVAPLASQKCCDYQHEPRQKLILLTSSILEHPLAPQLYGHWSACERTLWNQSQPHPRGLASARWIELMEFYKDRPQIQSLSLRLSLLSLSSWQKNDMARIHGKPPKL